METIKTFLGLVPDDGCNGTITRSFSIQSVETSELFSYSLVLAMISDISDGTIVKAKECLV